MLINQYVLQFACLVEIRFPVPYDSGNNWISALVSQLKGLTLETDVSHISDLSRNFTWDFWGG